MQNDDTEANVPAAPEFTEGEQFAITAGGYLKNDVAIWLEQMAERGEGRGRPGLTAGQVRAFAGELRRVGAQLLGEGG